MSTSVGAVSLTSFTVPTQPHEYIRIPAGIRPEIRYVMLKINFILNQQANDPKVPANKKRICPLADLLEDDEMIKNLAKAKSVERKDDGMFDGSSTASVGSQLDEILLEIKANGHISHYQFAEGWGHGIHLD